MNRLSIILISLVACSANAANYLGKATAINDDPELFCMLADGAERTSTFDIMFYRSDLTNGSIKPEVEINVPEADRRHPLSCRYKGTATTTNPYVTVEFENINGALNINFFSARLDITIQEEFWAGVGALQGKDINITISLTSVPVADF